MTKKIVKLLEKANSKRRKVFYARLSRSRFDEATEQLHSLLAMEKPLVDAVLFRARQMYDAGDDQAVELLH